MNNANICCKVLLNLSIIPRTVVDKVLCATLLFLKERKLVRIAPIRTLLPGWYESVLVRQIGIYICDKVVSYVLRNMINYRRERNSLRQP